MKNLSRNTLVPEIIDYIQSPTFSPKIISHYTTTFGEIFLDIVANSLPPIIIYNGISSISSNLTYSIYIHVDRCTVGRE